ncbi:MULTISPECIES: SCP2 sterol-binding domain-containing protein [unclassified Thermoplasma]|uniref:SCP2 sterol-binding domain-containing protein n=1 Tax=unclassified Thermoplasma TaxID=2684908 RepID=UPI000D861ECE|nr:MULTISPECIES: SCP2 sterol-binding domain-containing protein [unclassified Thermoplasma]PYB69165.1 sterol carrier protein [Thermoplasma sp. Kam2015]
MKDTLQQLVVKVNKKFENDPKYREKLKSLSRSINLEFDGKDNYHFYLKDSHLSDVEEGKIEADINVMVSSDVFNKILAKEIDPLTAYLTKQIRIKASLMDKLLISDLLK